MGMHTTVIIISLGIVNFMCMGMGIVNFIRLD